MATTWTIAVMIGASPDGAPVHQVTVESVRLKVGTGFSLSHALNV
ncbi:MULTISPECIES: hypothetical protein [Caulobacter]|uniref:Uncharacterized protein n=1 Tax=Caulobacter vibrioides OR37 TaxID=1292034 RepID=R0D0N2_CAUVI|nr:MULTISPECIES: hypothetical protein [Caulobacter]ENZ82045.1 hypothetical protein OR37_02090 [Caulobacter vibrioides OR37]